MAEVVTEITIRTAQEPGPVIPAGIPAPTSSSPQGEASSTTIPTRRAAIEHLGRIDTIETTATQIGKNAGKIERECDTVNSSIRRALVEAQTALDGAHTETDESEPVAAQTDGAA